MDAALWELYYDGSAHEVVPAIVRSSNLDDLPSYVKVIAQFGDISTIRLPRGKILETRALSNVASLKASRYLVPDEELDFPYSPEETFQDDSRVIGEMPTGKGVVVGLVDFGFDFAHPDFIKEDGTTRLLGLWDQRLARQSRNSPKPYGYGSFHRPEEINSALGNAEPYKKLGYHPASADAVGKGAHGTHVASIAVGNGRSGGPLGMAPEADIVFVHLGSFGPKISSPLGSSVSLLEAIDFIFKIADDRPCVINLSVGRHAQSHDGTTLVEQGLDKALLSTPNRAVCQSAGNYYLRKAHSSGRLRPRDEWTLHWEVEEADVTPNELEIWYSGRDIFDVEVFSPSGEQVGKVGLGSKQIFHTEANKVGAIYHRRSDPNNLDNHIEVYLYPSAPAGLWRVRLRGEDVVDGRFDAWIERDATCRGCQSQFAQEDVDKMSTTGSIANGERTIVVGAYNAHDSEHRIAPFSSAGPTRDKRSKPDLVAPGVAVLAARSEPKEDKSVSYHTRKSGTSMAAPHVTGTVACMFEAANRPLKIEETRNLLLGSVERTDASEGSLNRYGSGYLRFNRAIEAVMDSNSLVNSTIVSSGSNKLESSGQGKDEDVRGIVNQEMSMDNHKNLEDTEEQNSSFEGKGEEGAIENLNEHHIPKSDLGKDLQDTKIDESFVAPSETKQENYDYFKEDTSATGFNNSNVVEQEIGNSLHENEFFASDEVIQDGVNFEVGQDNLGVANEEDYELNSEQLLSRDFEVEKVGEVMDDQNSANFDVLGSVTSGCDDCPSESDSEFDSISIEDYDALNNLDEGNFASELIENLSNQISSEAYRPVGKLIDYITGPQERFVPFQLFDAIVSNKYPSLKSKALEHFEVLAIPKEHLSQSLQAGDLLIRRALGEGSFAHVALITNGDLVERGLLEEYGLQGESLQAGKYAQIIEFGPFPKSLKDNYARRITDKEGNLSFDQLILRPINQEQLPDLSQGHVCRPGEGPPTAVPDPEGKGLHPLVYRGTSTRRSRNPTVGYAQQLLNKFLLQVNVSPESCENQSVEALAFMNRGKTILRSNGQNPLIVDCRFGSNTDLATKMFQTCKGLERDGKIGPITWSHLEQYKTDPLIVTGGNPPDDSFGTCGVPSHFSEQELEAWLEEELNLVEHIQRNVQPALSLFQNHKKHRNHFECQAVRQANNIRAYSNPNVDNCNKHRHIGPTSFDTGANIVGALSAASQCLRTSVRTVHIFGHSGPHGIFGTTNGAHGLYVSGVSAASRRRGARLVTDIPVSSLSENVVFVLHGCRLASGNSNFARVLFQHLTASLNNPKVFGHHNGGCAGRDNSWREYSNRFPNGRRLRSIAPHYRGDGCCARRRRGENIQDVTESVLGPCPDVLIPPSRRPPLLIRGSVHPSVREVQSKLNTIHTQRLARGESGIRRAPLVPDCIFGGNTQKAVKSFQEIVFPGQIKEHDGKVGPKTWTELDRLTAGIIPIPPPPIIPPSFTPPAPPNPPLTDPVPRPCCMLEKNSLSSTTSLGSHSNLGGIIYTGKAGFIDIGHVRDLSDLTAFLYQQIHAVGGASGRTLRTTEGTATLTSTVPNTEWLEVARSIAFDDGLAHEINSYSSGRCNNSRFNVPGSHNSAFSPEDLCSNFLGTLVAERALIVGGIFASEVEQQIKTLLTNLDAQTLTETRNAFQLIDGRWVDSKILSFHPLDTRSNCYLKRRNFTRNPFKAGHSSDATTPAFVIAPFALATIPYTYTHNTGFSKSDFGSKIASIKTDARSLYGANFDKP